MESMSNSITSSSFAFASFIMITTATMLGNVGCAADDEQPDEPMAETEASLSGTVTGKCPQNHVCTYENANYNDLNPPSAWSFQFGPEELYQAALGRKFQRRFTNGKDKVSSIINNSKIRVCLINETRLGFSSTVLVRVNPGQRLGFVGANANDKADRIEEC
jgi:hypothetical protein